MKPLLQTRFGAEEGNCLQACLASLLERPLDEIPDFNQYQATSYQWYFKMEEWLRQQGYYLIRKQPGKYLPHGYFIMSGKSPRGLQHVVIMRGPEGASFTPELVHDPHPEGGGLVEEDEMWIFAATFGG